LSLSEDDDSSTQVYIQSKVKAVKIPVPEPVKTASFSESAPALAAENMTESSKEVPKTVPDASSELGAENTTHTFDETVQIEQSASFPRSLDAENIFSNYSSASTSRDTDMMSFFDEQRAHNKKSLQWMAKLEQNFTMIDQKMEKNVTKARKSVTIHKPPTISRIKEALDFDESLESLDAQAQLVRFVFILI
jgi:hypothetical protein